MPTKIMTRLRHALLVFLCVGAAIPAARGNGEVPGEAREAPDAALPRVMSLNLCADAYLMAFARPEQILGLTPQSSDPDLSAFVGEAGSFPTTPARLSEILKRRPDILILNNYAPPPNPDLVDRLGIRVIRLEAANSYRSARQEILDLGTAINRRSAAEAYLAELDESLSKARPREGAEKPTVINFQRRGIVVGENHILDDIIRLAGGYNLGRNRNRMIGPMSLENLLRQKPDYVLTLSETRIKKGETSGNPAGYASSGATSFETSFDRGSEVLHHPALEKRFGPERHLRIPQNLTVCAGATTPAAVAHLVKALSESGPVARADQIPE